jgi:hypothetical protein
MNIVYTFWTKPYFLKNNLYNNIINLLLSVSLSKKYASKITIYTDDYGKFILSRIIDNVILDTDILNKYCNSLSIERWAIPKLYVMNNQNKPFLHIDHDVFLWENILNINDHDLIVQSFEFNGFFPIFYKELFINYISNNENKHDFLTNHLIENDFAGYNCGFINAKNINFIKKWTNFGIDLNNNYKNNFRFIDCTFVEQFSLYALVKKFNIKINEIIPMISYEQDGEIHLKYDTKIKYTHLMGAKNKQKTVEKVENKIQELFPNVYNKLLNNIFLLKKK